MAGRHEPTDDDGDLSGSVLAIIATWMLPTNVIPLC